MNITEIFLIAMLIILTAPYLVWRLFKLDYFAPLVVVQILTGILLGPGVLGAAFPGYYNFVFNPAVIQSLNGIAWWAVMLFVWIAGIELDLKAAWTHKRESSVAAGLALGMPLLFGCIAAAAGLTILAQGHEIEVAVLAGKSIDIGVAPGIGRHTLGQIGAVPFGFIGRSRDEGGESLLGHRIVAGIEPVLVERFFQCVNLGARRLDLGLANLSEVLRPHIARQQSDDDHDHQQFEQRKSGRLGLMGPVNGLDLRLHKVPVGLPLAPATAASARPVLSIWFEL